MFRLLRYYSAASLAVVAAAALLSCWLYREISVENLHRLAERNNLHLARMALGPLRPALLDYLQASSGQGPGAAMPPGLSASIRLLMQDRFIMRIKLYDATGMVVFSTRPDQIGNVQGQNPGFLAARRGEVGYALVYRDSFNSLDGETEDDNLMQTYLPVRAGPAEAIRGVFEIYTDVNDLVQRAERTQFMVMMGTIAIMVLLYAALIMVVRHAQRTIALQQRTIAARTETLQLLSTRLLESEESIRRRLAVELHEGLAQTLAAIKLQAENRLAAAAGPGAVSDSIVAVLQETIQEVRDMATDLRPPSLDQLGLLPTLRGLCREIEQRQPGRRIALQLGLDEPDVPVPLKLIVYRIVESVLAAPAPTGGSVRLQLMLAGQALVLQIEMPAPDQDSPPAGTGAARMEDLVLLSGGDFSQQPAADGGTMLRASWRCR